MANRYWVGGSGTWNSSSTTNWSATSGGSSGASAPTAADDVFIDGNSGAPTITLSGIVGCRSFNATGATGTLATGTSPNRILIGDGTAGASNIAWSQGGLAFTGTTAVLEFQSTSATQQTIDPNGVTFQAVTINAPGASYILTNNFATNFGGRLFTITAGTFNDGGYSVSFGKFNSSNTNVRTIIATGDWTCTNVAGGTSWTTNTVTNLTWSFTGLLTLGGSGATQTVTPGSREFGAVSFTTAAAVALTGSFQTTRELIITAPKTITVTNGRSITVGGAITMKGSSGNLITLLSDSAGTPFTMSRAYGVVACDWLSLKDCTATGGATWYAGANSTNVSGNTGWSFIANASSGFFALMG